MRIDAHQYFFDFDRFDYPWVPPPPSLLRRDFLPKHLEPILRRSRFDGSVAMQAAASLDETRWLLDLAADHDLILGVAGWVDLSEARAAAALDEFQRHPKFRGVRYSVSRDLEHSLGGLRELARRGLPLDLAVEPDRLSLVRSLAEAVPDLRIAILHIARPAAGGEAPDHWIREIEQLAALPQVFGKLSGLVPDLEPEKWDHERLRPCVRHVLGQFGPERLMFASEWPVCLLAGKWKATLAAFTQLIGAQTIAVREELLGGTAQRFYGLEATSGS